MILPVLTMIIFLSIAEIDPLVPDSATYIQASENLPKPHEIRTPVYPLFLKLTGVHVILIQSILWLLTAFLILVLTSPVCLIFYSFTIGLLFLSQKILTETLFVFILILTLISKKNMGFIWICLSVLIKPLMLIFIPVAAFLKPKIQFIIVGLALIACQSIAMKITYNTFRISKVGEYTYVNYLKDKGISGYIENVWRNSLGKTVGIEKLFWQRITQVQCLFYTLIGISGLIYFRKNPLYVLPLYIILISGIAGKQGDRLHLIIVPISLMILSEHFEKLKQLKYVQ